MQEQANELSKTESAKDETPTDKGQGHITDKAEATIPAYETWADFDKAGWATENTPARIVIKSGVQAGEFVYGADGYEPVPAQPVPDPDPVQPSTPAPATRPAKAPVFGSKGRA
jgi:hypothetical protein